MKSENRGRIGIPHDEDDARAYRSKSRVWRPAHWNNGGEWYDSVKAGRRKFRPKRKEVK
jgi:hypothetical protein